MPERVLIETCSPTLAGMKPANLISLPYQNEEQARADIREMNRIFVRKGLRAVPLNFRKSHVLLYLYRPASLKQEFAGERVRSFLEPLGYDCSDADRCVVKLGEKIRAGRDSAEFPHEVGIFLGYPLEDVEGFIHHKEEGTQGLPELPELHKSLSSFVGVREKPGGADGSRSRSIGVKISFS